MPTDAPLCCSQSAYKLLARQVQAINHPDALLHGAVAIAMHQLEDCSIRTVDRQLKALADRVRARVKGPQPQALLAHLHDVLFDEEGFIGNETDYGNPLNSYVPAVLENKKGLPITLCLIYKAVAERLGLKAWGIGLPGHFLAGIECGTESLFVDCYASGRTLTSDEAHDQMRKHLGPDVGFSTELLQPVSNRRYLTRIIQNLLNHFSNTDHYADVAAMLEMEMLLWPEQQHLKRDLGLVLARCGLCQPACVWLDRYLETNPQDPQTEELRQLCKVLR